MSKHHFYSETEIKFLIDNSPLLTRKKLTDLFNKQFGTDISVKSITFKCNSLKSYGKSERFNIGDIVERKDGYLLIKVSNDNSIPQYKRWCLYHRFLWEQKNGVLPKGKTLIFKDGNRKNCKVENLILVDREILPIMAQNNFYSSEAELTECGVNVSMLIREINKKRK